MRSPESGGGGELTHYKKSASIINEKIKTMDKLIATK